MTPKIYWTYINLDRSQERRTSMEKQFSALGVTVKRMPGLDASAGFRGVKLSYAPERRLSLGSPLTDGEIACNESHMRAWQAFLDSDCSFAVILEDDAELAADLVATVEDIVSTYTGWDAVRLEWRKQNGTLGKANWPLKNNNALVIPKNMTLGQAGFLFTRDGARRALECMRAGHWASVDYNIGQLHLSQLRYFQIRRPVVRELPFASDIGDRYQISSVVLSAFAPRTIVQRLRFQFHRSWSSLRRRMIARRFGRQIKRIK